MIKISHTWKALVLQGDKILRRIRGTKEAPHPHDALASPETDFIFHASEDEILEYVGKERLIRHYLCWNVPRSFATKERTAIDKALEKGEKPAIPATVDVALAEIPLWGEGRRAAVPKEYLEFAGKLYALPDIDLQERLDRMEREGACPFIPTIEQLNNAQEPEEMLGRLLWARSIELARRNDAALLD